MSGRARSISLRGAEAGFAGSFQAMGSPCEVLVELDDQEESERLTRLVASEAWRIEDTFSRYRQDNIIARINAARGEPVTLDAETTRLIDFAELMFDISDGKFDVTSGVLRRAWTFDGGNAVPRPEDINAILPLVGWNKVNWNPPVLEMPAEMQIDLGGIGKEYAVDRVSELLRSETDAACLANFGGDLVAVRQPTRRPAWRVGIESLQEGRLAETLIDLTIGALATSGDARRFVTRDGQRFGHILDPGTGWPVTDAPRSVTVAADTCTQAGMLATLAMLKGAAAEEFLQREADKYWCQR